MGPFDILAEQHRELEERFETLDAGDGTEDAEQQRERAQELMGLLRRHTLLEERCLYPLLHRREGREREREEAEEHLTLGELMDELEEQPPGGPEWWARLMALEDLLVAHVREEEAKTFPLLMTGLEQGEREQLRHALEALRDELSSPPHAYSGHPSLRDGTAHQPGWDV